MIRMTKVVKIKRKDGKVVQDCDIYIGRRCNMGGWKLKDSIWANPFKINQHGSREEVLKKYKEYILQKPELLDQLHTLDGKVLGCFCREKDRKKGEDAICHGDILVDLLNEQKKNKKVKKITFYKEQEKPYGVFSNYYGKQLDRDFKLKLDNLEWPTTEHYFQAQKFLGESANKYSHEYAEIIRNATTPNIAKILASQKTGGGYKWRTDLNPIIQKYKEKGVKIRDDWEKEKEIVMMKALIEKFTKNQKLLCILVLTKNAEIIEDNPRDEYWAIGKGNGKNRLGVLLMKLRDRLLELVNQR